MKDYVEVVINSCFGGYGLSELAIDWLQKRGYNTPNSFDVDLIENRMNVLLVKCVKALGDKSFGYAAHLKVVKIPKDEITRELCIREYDGNEWVQEVTKEWYGA